MSLSYHAIQIISLETFSTIKRLKITRIEKQQQLHIWIKFNLFASIYKTTEDFVIVWNCVSVCVCELSITVLFFFPPEFDSFVFGILFHFPLSLHYVVIVALHFLCKKQFWLVLITIHTSILLYTVWIDTKKKKNFL